MKLMLINFLSIAQSINQLIISALHIVTVMSILTLLTVVYIWWEVGDF